MLFSLKVAILYVLVAMGLFDDSEKLFNMSFPWGLGKYTYRDPEALSPPPDLDSISVYVDDDGRVNADEQISLHKVADPLDGPVMHTYSSNNNFIAGLNRALTTVPIGGLILFPTYKPRLANPSPRRFWGAGLLPRYQGRIRYPIDTPPGFVPAVGQVLKYPDGGVWQVTEMAPPITAWGAWEGGRLGGRWNDDDGYEPSYNYLPQVRYLQRVPEGWSGPDPVLRGGASALLDEIRPDRVWDWFWWGGNNEPE